jgi:hypothetical protein
MKKCYECYVAIPDDADMFCENCRNMLNNGELVMTFPGVAGVSDGPGSMARETNFMRPDVPKEMTRCFRRWEENGKFKKEPGLREKCDFLLKKAKEDKKKLGRQIKYDKGDAHLLGGIL